MFIRSSPFHFGAPVFWAAFAFLSLLLPSFASAQDRPQGADACTLENSAKLSISRALGKKADYIGECVAISGTLAGEAIYETIGDVYLASPLSSGDVHNRIGLAAGSSGNFDGHRGSLRLIGRLVDCDAVQRRIALQIKETARKNREENTLIFMERPVGFCGDHSGLAIKSDVITPLDLAGFTRLTSDRDRRRFGDLAVFDENHPFAAQIEAIAEYTRNQKCTSKEPKNIGSIVDSRFSSPVINGPDAPFQWSVNAFFRDDQRDAILANLCTKKQLQTALFTLSSASPYYGQQRGPTHFHALQCYCLEEDCEGKWPIALIDTVWDPQLPYFCESFYDYARNRWNDLEGIGPMNYSGWSVDFPRNNSLGMDNPMRIAMFLEPN